GTVEQIKATYGKERSLTVQFAEKVENLAIFMPQVKIIEVNQNKKRFIFNKEQVQVHQLIAELSAQYAVADISIQEPEIESIIKEIYEGRIGNRAGVC
ncbi:MAG TPA: DUF4162 domain-containing protein, partial [Bacillota bacterium]|nr:DUF4162 domain-containing protein [Bacillota bacterium]